MPCFISGWKLGFGGTSVQCSGTTVLVYIQQTVSPHSVSIFPSHGLWEEGASIPSKSSQLVLRSHQQLAGIARLAARLLDQRGPQGLYTTDIFL